MSNDLVKVNWFSITVIRWQLFKWISAIGWMVCPEPHKTNLQKHMNDWRDMNDVDGA